jgi:hypothetical protein
MTSIQTITTPQDGLPLSCEEKLAAIRSLFEGKTFEEWIDEVEHAQQMISSSDIYRPEKDWCITQRQTSLLRLQIILGK